MLSRTSDVRSTPIGQSVDQLAGRRMSKHLWRALAAAAGELQLNGRAERCLGGRMGGGYTALWVLTTSDLLALTERPDGTRILPLTQIVGVARPAASALRVIARGPESVALQAQVGEIDAFARALATRANVPIVGVEGLFATDRFVPFTGPVHRVGGWYLGGYGDLARGRVVLSFDDEGAHVAPADAPWRQAAMLAWQDIRGIHVEGYEETRQRVTLTRAMALGPLAIAVPKDEDRSRAYVTVETASGDLVVRVDQVPPQELRVRLGDVLRRAAGTRGDGAGLVDEIARLGELHASGVLTAEEFAAAKRKLLGL